MMRISKRQRKLRLALCCAVANFQVVGNVYAQSNPGLFYGQVPTAAQWNSYFAGKQNYPATTQAQGDNTTNVATDAFVLQNASTLVSGTSCSAPLNLYQLSATGSIPTIDLNIWDGTECVQWGILDTLTHTITLTNTNAGNAAVPVGVFGAICDGATDDSSAINTGLASVPSGTSLLLPTGKTCKVNSTINFGNGSSAAVSTVNGVILTCLANPMSTSYFGGDTKTTGCRLLWGGGASSFIQVNGPMQGWGIQNTYIDCGGSGSGASGIKAIAAQGGDLRNFVIDGCQNGYVTATYPAFGSGADAGNDHNHLDNYQIVLPSINNSVGMLLTGQATDATTNTHHNLYTNGNIFIPLTSGTFTAVQAQATDSETFVDLDIFGGGSACTAILYDYSLHNQWPAGVQLVNVDPGQHCATSYANTGTPSGAGIKPNVLVAPAETNAVTPIPSLNNLSVLGSHNLILAAPGNVTPIQIAASSTGSPEYQGTPTNDSALAGYVGEYISASLASGSAVSIATSGTPTNVVSISLTAGDWDASCFVDFTASGSAASTDISTLLSSIGTSSAANNTSPGFFSQAQQFSQQAFLGAGVVTQNTGPQRFSLSSTTTVYCVADPFFTGSAGNGNGPVLAYGMVRARRVR